MTITLTHRILKACERHSKVARVILKVRSAFAAEGLHISDIAIARRIRSLAQHGAVEAFGDLKRWRYSEIRRTRLLRKRELGKPSRFFATSRFRVQQLLKK